MSQKVALFSKSFLAVFMRTNKWAFASLNKIIVTQSTITYMESDVDFEAASSRVALVTRSECTGKWFLSSVGQLVRL